MDYSYFKTLFLLLLIVFLILITLDLALSLFSAKRKRKKIISGIMRFFMAVSIPASVASIMLTLLYTAHIVGYSVWTAILGDEAVCFALISAAYLSVFAISTKKMKAARKTVFAASGAVLFTVEVFFINNANRLMSFLDWFRSQETDYWQEYVLFMKSDLNYKEGLGIFRYVLLFLIQFALFGILIIIKSEKAIRVFVSAKDRTKTAFLIAYRRSFGRSDLEELTDLCEKGLIPSAAVADYLNSAKRDEFLMHDLIHCAKKYGLDVYMDMVFVYYGNVLSKKQYLCYRELFLDEFDRPLCDACEELDKKFGIESAGEYRETRKYTGRSADRG